MPLWTDPGIKSGISGRELISTWRGGGGQVGNDWSNILPKSLPARNKAPPVERAPSEGAGSLENVENVQIYCSCRLHSVALSIFMKYSLAPNLGFSGFRHVGSLFTEKRAENVWFMTQIYAHTKSDTELTASVQKKKKYRKHTRG